MGATVNGAVSGHDIVDSFRETIIPSDLVFLPTPTPTPTPTPGTVLEDFQPFTYDEEIGIFTADLFWFSEGGHPFTGDDVVSVTSEGVTISRLMDGTNSADFASDVNSEGDQGGFIDISGYTDIVLDVTFTTLPLSTSVFGFQIRDADAVVSPEDYFEVTVATTQITISVADFVMAGGDASAAAFKIYAATDTNGGIWTFTLHSISGVA